MANFRTGNMWFNYHMGFGLFLVTTNSYIKKNGELVMGRGAAKQLRDISPGIDSHFGKEIKESCGHLGIYGLKISPFYPMSRFGLFQVKKHFKDKADLNLIKESCDQLIKWCNENKGENVDLNFPGIGNGGLSYENVYPVVNQLPDQVNIWTYSNTP